MPLKKELQQKVPASIRAEPQFQALWDLVGEKKIASKPQLAKYLQQKIALLEKELKENQKQGATSVKLVRDQAVELDWLKKSQKLVEEFL